MDAWPSLVHSHSPPCYPGKLTIKVFWVKPPAAHSGNGGALEKQVLGSGESVTCAQSGQIKVTVTDTGAGLSEEQLKQLFSDGIQFNVNQLQAGQGSGLGLYIAKGIVEQHGGILSAASEGLGHGSTFTMTLPAYHIPESALPGSLEHLQKRKLTATEQNFLETYVSSLHHDGPLRTLVVDDAVTNRKLLSRLLERRGHSCDQAKDGQEAVQKVMESLKNGNPYATILMDYEMPVMDGPTASKEIRALGCDSIIVGVTGNALPEDIAYFKSCGANAILLKPFEMEALDEILVESAKPCSLEHLQKRKHTETEHNSSETYVSWLHHDGPHRTLVVDDAVTNRKLLSRLLERRGHSCDQAKDGQEAVQKVMESLKNGNPYATILMDYEMPVMDGPTASKEIRALGCDSLIVGVTGNALPEDIAHFKSCGANAILLKPFEMEALDGIMVEFGVTLQHAN
jgi:CheY-like chemotaxis protein